jgi:hypothetical protein
MHTRALALRARFRAGGVPTTAERRLEELEAELVLLREENARLAAQQVRPANPGRVVEQLRAVPATPEARESEADDAWEQMAEALVTRELLLSVSIELERLGARLREQLEPGTPRTAPVVLHLEPAGEGLPRLHPSDSPFAIPVGARNDTFSSATEGV